MKPSDFTEEERLVLIEGLEALERRLRDNARPRPDRRKEYDPAAARHFYLAKDLHERLSVAD